MRIALSSDNKLIEPEYSGQQALCPSCEGKVIGKCGPINVWHWQHFKKIDCDIWHENLSPWHLKWQNYFRSRGADIEPIIVKNGIKHRADAIMRNGIIIEIQYSYLSADEIKERELFYQNMIWIFHARNDLFSGRLDIRPNGLHGGSFSLKQASNVDYCTYRWKHAKRSISYAKNRVFLDIWKGYLFELKKIHLGPPCGGWGVLKKVKVLI